MKRIVESRAVLAVVLAGGLSWGCAMEPPSTGDGGAIQHEAGETSDATDETTPPGDGASEAGDAGESPDVGVVAEGGPADGSSADGATDASTSDASAASEASTSDASMAMDAGAGDGATGGIVCSPSADAGSTLPAWCIDGAACTPAENQCDVGALSCATLTCSDTGRPAPDGTPCSSGTCQGGFCSEVCSAPSGVSTNDCSPDACTLGGCVSGSCQANPLIAVQLAPDGVPCGDLPNQVCRSGVCTLVRCIEDSQCPSGQRCNAPISSCSLDEPCPGYNYLCFPGDSCEDSSRNPLPDGTACAPDGICINGYCPPGVVVTGQVSSFAVGPFSGTVALVGSSITVAVANLTATVDWGDGTTSAGRVVASDSHILVDASHTYAAPAAVLLGVTVTDTSNGATGSTRFAATVGASPVADFPIPHGVESITSGPDGDLWLTESTGNLGRVTPQGTFTELPLPSGSFANQITAGPDGALWFTNSGANAIGRMTPTGTLTSFPIPTASAGPAGITGGSDGNLWFTEEALGQVARVTPAGTFTEFPTAPSRPTAITSGSDGNLWFVETGTNSIGRMTPDGRYTDFPIPPCVLQTGSAANFAVAIAAGPDGNLWFTVGSEDSAHGLVGRLTTSGAFDVFHPVFDASTPTAIAAGPDGNLWVLDGLNDNVDRVTPAGAITPYIVTSFATSPFAGITAGPDGNLWFGESAGTSISRLALH